MTHIGKYILCLLFLIALERMRGDELSEFIQVAYRENSALKAQAAVVLQQLEAHREIREFLDPTLFAAGGYASYQRDLPLELSGYNAVDSPHSAEVQAGATIPIESGAHLAVGAIGRRRYHYSDTYNDSIFQHLIGANLKIPLLRDRGFILLDKQLSAALAEHQAALQTLLAEKQRVRHGVEQAYIGVCEAQVNYRISRDATERFLRLHDEAQEMVRLHSLPDYELQKTLRDLQNGREDEEIARNKLETSLKELANAVGNHTLQPSVTCTIDLFRKQAEKLSARKNSAELESCAAQRGEILSLISLKEKARFDFERYTESQRDDVSLSAGVTYQADSTGAPLRSHRLETPRYWGGEVMLTWSRPLYKTGDQARVKRFAAKMDELQAQIDEAKTNLALELRCAEVRYDSALHRLKIVGEGITAAQQLVLSEQERFKMGDSTSTDVLDAQKELTAVLKRFTTAVADALRASSDLQYACGYIVSAD